MGRLQLVPDLLPPLEIPLQRREVLHRDLLPLGDPPPGPHPHLHPSWATARVQRVPGVAHALVRHNGEDGVETLAHRLLLHRRRRRHPAPAPSTPIGELERHRVDVEYPHGPVYPLLRPPPVGRHPQPLPQPRAHVPLVPLPLPCGAAPPLHAVVHQRVRAPPLVAARVLQQEEPKRGDEGVQGGLGAVGWLPGDGSGQRGCPLRQSARKDGALLRRVALVRGGSTGVVLAQGEAASRAGGRGAGARPEALQADWGGGVVGPDQAARVKEDKF